MALAAFLAGCLGADDEPRPARGAPLAISEVVDRLERATADGDYALICRDLFTAAARRRAGGPDCARLTRSAAAGVERPSLDLVTIDLRGATARVRVQTRASGQVVLTEVLLLRRQGGEWRVDALGG
ncbi:MAG: hypothetical protein QOE60_1769 [Thermoleophilaceae bacterium]|jgi:hypothetical protein|nr:hypothetical protein [Thermoleophilaceae bacterium]